MGKIFDAKKVQKDNWSALENHISRNKEKIAPGVNLGTIYAGKTNGIDLESEIEKILPIGKGNKLRSELEPVWKSINRANNRQIAKTGKLAYDTLVDVIKDLAAPVLHNPGDGTAITFRNLYECVDLVHKDKVRPPIIAEGNQRLIWTKLSAIYTANCKGKLTQIEGVLEGYANLSGDKDMIKKELETALKNQDIDQASKKKTIELVEKYFDKISGAGPGMVADLERLKKDLSKEATVSDKPRK